MNKEIEHNKFWQDTYYYAGAYLAGGPAGIAGAFLGLAAYQYIKLVISKHSDSHFNKDSDTSSLSKTLKAI